MWTEDPAVTACVPHSSKCVSGLLFPGINVGRAPSAKGWKSARDPGPRLFLPLIAAADHDTVCTSRVRGHCALVYPMPVLRDSGEAERLTGLASIDVAGQRHHVHPWSCRLRQACNRHCSRGSAIRVFPRRIDIVLETLDLAVRVVVCLTQRVVHPGVGLIQVDCISTLCAGGDVRDLAFRARCADAHDARRRAAGEEVRDAADRGARGRVRRAGHRAGAQGHGVGDVGGRARAEGQCAGGVRGARIAQGDRTVRGRLVQAAERERAGAGRRVLVPFWCRE